MKIARRHWESAVGRALKRSPAVAMLGPRQCGKTTLAQMVAGARAHWFDLENPRDLARLSEPMLALEPLRGLVVLDEIQRRADLFPVLRVLLDRKPLPARFLILGSAAPELLRQSSETLAGRIEHIDIGGFSIAEVGPESWRRLWVRGGFPKSFLARSEADSLAWRADFVRTFLERDLAQLGFRAPSETVRRFWSMAANQSSDIWNASAIGSSMGEAHTTANRRLDTLCSALVLRRLRPWSANLAKREVKSPKVYVRDTGLLHFLLGIRSLADLEGHPRKGASWESFAIEQILSVAGERDAYFWRTQAGAELDLLLLRNGKKLGFEFKFSDSPQVTKSMHIAKADLGLDELFLVTPGIDSFPLGDGISAKSIGACLEALQPQR